MLSKEKSEITLEYKLIETDLAQCIEFAVNLYTGKKGSLSSRTTGQSRGLGTIINDWVGGKAIEIGIKEMLERLAPSKKIILDFSIYDTNKKAQDPDIIKVEENGETRDPNLFVEIKNVGPYDRWIGLSEDQFKTTKNKVSGNLSKIFIVYAQLIDVDNDLSKKTDLLGTFLKTATKKNYSKLFKDFASVGKVIVRTEFVITGNDLENNGVLFTTKDFLYETEVLALTRQKTESLKEITINGNTLPKFQPDKNYPYPEKIGDIKFTGNAKAFIKINKKSERMLIKCETNVIAKNKVLGEFRLLKDNVYDYNPGVAGRNPAIFRNNIWIAVRNAKNISSLGTDDTLKEIATKI